MFAEERRQAIARTLRAQGRVQAHELARRFSVADETIRRDLKWLEDSGEAVRTHGGALRREVGALPPLAQRASTASAAKQAIGRAAARLVGEGESIFIDSGSTALELARALRGRHDLHVVTNSLLVAGELAVENGIVVHLPGGAVQAGEMCLVGPEAVQGIARYQAARAFISGAGIDATRGLAVFNPFEAEVKRAMLENALHTVVIADGTKLGRTALVAVAGIDMIDLLMTDTTAAPDIVAQLREAGLAVEMV